jgi:hypothetical protein
MSSLSNHYFEIRIKIKNIYILLQTDMDEHIIDLEEIVEKQAWQLYMTSRKKGFPKKRKEVNIEFDWSGLNQSCILSSKNTYMTQQSDLPFLENESVVHYFCFQKQT